jgi:nucleoside-diphosphate-sugar epimerase
MTIVVTGASGFIGSFLAERLANEGHQVRACYRSKPHYRIKEHPGIEWHFLDLNSQQYDKALLKGADGLIHAAAIANDWGSEEVFDGSNLVPVQKLIDVSKEVKLPWMIFISSLAVQGFGDHRQSTEEGPYYDHVSYYQSSKLKAEELVIKSNSKDFKTNIIRPGNVYGPDDTNVSYQMFDYISKHKAMVILDGGKALTCPVYVDDLVSACVNLVNSQDIAGEIFNITSGEQITWKECATLMNQLINASSKVSSVSSKMGLFLANFLAFIHNIFRIKTAPLSTKYRVMQVSNNYSFSIEKAKQLLNYQPKTFYKEGIAIAIEAYKQRNENGNS